MAETNVIPFAEQRLTTENFNQNSVTRPPRGMVLHIAQGSYEGTIQWAKNPDAGISYYAVVSKKGAVAQVVLLDDKAWTQGSGNAEWIGVEFEGKVPDALTDEQVEAAAKILAWLHNVHGVPFQRAEKPDETGLGWHGMGGLAWGGHFGCPGTSIVVQRDKIIARATKIAGTPPPTVPIGGVIVQPIRTVVDPRTKSAWTLMEDGGVLTEQGAVFYGAWGNLPSQTRTNANLLRFYDFTLRRDGQLGYTIWVLSKAGATLEYNFPLAQ